MTVGMFSPYVPKHFGGGERHFLTTAAYLSQQHQVEILLASVPLDLKTIIATYEDRFDIDLSAVGWRESKLATGQQFALATWRETARYDAFFYLTDGSLFLNGSRRGVLHVQIPFSQPLSLINRAKLKTWQILNTNSEFTRKIIEESWGRPADVVHTPFVDTANVPEKLPKKQNEILSVGRIFAPGAGHNKKQDVMIKAFIQGCKKHGWDKTLKLHIVGALEPGEKNAAYAESLKQLAKGWPIEFHLDVSNDQVLKLYARCKIFWHAAGFEINEHTHPELVEHFGMTPLEAQAWGCIPIVVPKGGITETITPGETGLTYQSIPELIQQTNTVLKLTPTEQSAWQDRVRAASQRYSLARFCRTIDQMIGMPATL